MPYCPSCLSEYRPGVDRCSDCGAELLEGTPPPATSQLPKAKSVHLCQVADPSEADIIRAALAEAGIPCVVQEHGPLTARLTRVVDGATHDYAVIFVADSRLEEARRVLEVVRSAQVEWPEGMEPDDSANEGEAEQ